MRSGLAPPLLLTGMRCFFANRRLKPSAATMRVSYEDSDISKRLWKLGWEVHFIDHSRCVSIQKDTLRSLAVKQLRDTGWFSPAESSLAHLYLYLTKWTIIRAGRNVVKGRFYFLPVDITLWAYALWIATERTVKHIFGRH